MGLSKGTKELLKCVIICWVGVMLGNLITTFIIFRAEVSGVSMQPTYTDGEKLWASRNFKVERGDVVVVKEEHEDAWGTISYSYLIKRVIGMPGEKIEISGTQIFVNDSELTGIFPSIPAEPAGVGFDYVILGDDEYYVLGDNRGNSRDSRYFGAVKRDCLVGRVFDQR